MNRIALYFGFCDSRGHDLAGTDKRSVRPDKIPGFPWTYGHMDTGLLNNGNHADRVDGKVFWTCGGRPLWNAFFWWDRSGVKGFDYTERREAFEFACAAFPLVVSRQACPLILQNAR